jgi:hypothetical protein
MLDKLSLAAIAMVLVFIVIAVASVPSAAELQKKKLETMMKECIEDGHPEWFCYSKLKDCK